MRHIIFAFGFALLLAASASAKVINLKEAPYSAIGDGVADDRAALARALGEARTGDTVLIPPGRYRIALSKGPLAVPEGVTLWGQSGKCAFVLQSDGGRSDHREFLRLGSAVTLEGIGIERDGDFPAVLLPLFGNIRDITIRHCRIAGHAERFPQPYCHAIQVGNGTLKNLVLDGIEMEGCTYGLFQANESTGTVEGVTVSRSRFSRNSSSDLEFNSPKGTMRNITVTDCFFRDNQSKSASGGFAVGFANVTNGRVENCFIKNYFSEALHVEDRSADIVLAGNTIVGGSIGLSNGVIMVVNNSRKISIARNFVDARPNTKKTHLVLVTAGGKDFANPAEVSVTENVFINSAVTQTWYLQPGSGPAPVGNLVFPAENPNAK